MEDITSLTLQVGAENSIINGEFRGYRSTVCINHTRVWHGGGTHKTREDAIAYGVDHFSRAVRLFLDREE